MPRKRPQVLGGDLNRSESSRAALSFAAPHRPTAQFERAGRCQAADRSRIEGIGPSHISHRLARAKPLQRFLALMRSHLAGAPELHASILGTFAALARLGADQLTLELGQAAKRLRYAR